MSSSAPVSLPYCRKTGKTDPTTASRPSRVISGSSVEPSVTVVLPVTVTRWVTFSPDWVSYCTLSCLDSSPRLITVSSRLAVSPSSESRIALRNSSSPTVALTPSLGS